MDPSLPVSNTLTPNERRGPGDVRKSAVLASSLSLRLEMAARSEKNFNADMRASHSWP